MVSAVAEGFSWGASPLWPGGGRDPVADVRTPLATATVYLIFVLLANATTPRDEDVRRKSTALGNRAVELRRDLKRWSESSTAFYMFSVLHNVLLVCFSLVILTAVVIEAAPLFLSAPFREIICPSPSMEGKLMTGPCIFWCYLYYVSKYYELLDTLLMAIKGKHIIFLHVYHHLIMLPSMWLCLNGDLKLSLVGIAILNSAVHVIMYTYYLLSILKWPTRSWKHLVTKVQILQFVVGAFGGGAFLCFYVKKPTITTGWPWISFEKGCAGDSTAIVATILVNLSFLFLFVQFFRRAYQPSTHRSDTKKTT